MRRTLIGSLVLMGGCWLSDAEVLGRYGSEVVEPDTDLVSAETSAVVSVTPEFGTNAGEQQVVIEVDAIGSDLTVMFGTVPAEVVSTDGTTITVRTPRGDAGATDVAVTSGGGTGTLAGGYWYWEDDAGAFGTLGDVAYYDYTGDLDRLGYLDKTTANIEFVEGSFEDYSAAFGMSLDTCQLGILGLNPTPLDLQAPDILLQADGGSPKSVVYDSSSTSYAGELSGETTPGVAYRMLPFDGSGPFPAFGVDPIADVPQGFRITQPDFTSGRTFSESLGDDVSRFDFTLEWTQPDAADYVVLELIQWQANSTNSDWVVVQVASCLVVDDGSFQVPESLWPDWYFSAPMDVYVSRIRTSEGVLPHNNSVNGVVGRSIVAGTLWQALF